MCWVYFSIPVKYEASGYSHVFVQSVIQVRMRKQDHPGDIGGFDFAQGPKTENLCLSLYVN